MSNNDDNIGKSELEQKLLRETKLVWEVINEEERNKVRKFANDYKNYIGIVKTERLAISEAIIEAEKHGFNDISTVNELKPGDKVFFVNRKKNIILAIIGQDKITNGSHMVASHVDSPRIDLKVNPVYEDENLALLHTHYYGGVKKYHWVNIPLAMYGVIAKKDGTMIDVSIGDDPNDPVFVISDILPHLSRKVQGDRKMAEVVKGEELISIAGSLPVLDEEVKKKRVKLNFLKLLNDKYGIIEEDFLSAELTLVPAIEPRFVGLDKGMLAAYGHDDRICAFTSLKAIFEAESPDKTSLCYLMDKEEIGSDGNVGAQSNWILHVMSELLEKTGEISTNTNLFKTMTNMKTLSSDVNAGMHPVFKSTQESMNAAHMGKGVVLTKYTGSGGKYSSNDAHAEFVGYIRQVFDEAKVVWQTGQLGKVDEGGGGTIAKFLAKHNADVIDIGPGILGMHSPYELCHVGDLYMTYRAYVAFYRAK